MKKITALVMAVLMMLSLCACGGKDGDKKEKVKKGDILIEGASVNDGELALGKDLLVAFMPWRGYNMDDAIVISSRLVEDDELTSINIKD